MAKDYGKKFEKKFHDDFQKTLPDSTIIRLYDQMSGLYGSKNICDFIGYIFPNMYLLECKSHAGASIPIENITQLDTLVQYMGKDGVRAGVVLWLYDKQTVWYIPIFTVDKMKNDGYKSINPEKAITDGYRIISIPGTIKRTFIDSDYSILKTLEEGD